MPGAEEGNAATQTGPYFDMLTLPVQGEVGGVASGTEAYYAFDYGNIHFIALDSSQSDRSPTGPMLTWLKSDLAANTRTWTIAFWHHAPYSRGANNSDTDANMAQMRQNAGPILEAGGVDVVLAGHSHDYERSVLLDGHYGASPTLTAAMKKDAGNDREDGTGAYRKPSAGPAPHEGAVYVLAGSSGQISGGSLDHPTMLVSLTIRPTRAASASSGRPTAPASPRSPRWAPASRRTQAPGCRRTARTGSASAPTTPAAPRATPTPPPPAPSLDREVMTPLR